MRSELLKSLSGSIRFLAILIAAPLMAFPAWGNEEIEAKEILRRVQSVYEGYTGFEAGFRQVSKLKSLKEPQVQEGKIYIKKPGRMRWDYIKPEKKVFLCREGKIWAYFPDDKEALLYRDMKGAVAETAINFLMGQGSLLRDFTPLGGVDRIKDGTLFSITLKPVEEGINLSTLNFEIEGKSNLVKGITTVDLLGNETRVDFSGIRLKKEMDEKIFDLNLPADVEVTEMGGG